MPHASCSQIAADRQAVSGVVKVAVAISMLTASVFAVGCAHAPAVARPPTACEMVDLPDSDALVRVPMRIVDGRIYVQARVNDLGPFTFAVDTGASGMGRADSSLVSTLKLAVHGETSNSDGVQTSKVETTRLASLQLGDLGRQNLEVITRDYSSKLAKSAAFSGIIAREFFADGLLILDYPKQTLSFTRARGLSQGDKGVLGYERAFRVPVSIGGTQVEGQLDTGANVTFVFPQSLYDRVQATPLQQAGKGTLTNGKIETQRATVKGPFRIGGASLSDVEVRVSDRFPELLVGAHVLQNYVVLIDQRSKTVAICE